MQNYVLIGDDEVAVRAIGQRFENYRGFLFSRQDSWLRTLAGQGRLIGVGEDPVQFLRKKILPDGFGLLAGHARDVSWSKVWAFCRRELTCVRVRRKRPAHAYLERCPRLHPEILRDLLDKCVRQHEEWDEYFRGARTEEIVYEDDLQVSDSLVKIFENTKYQELI